MTQLLKRPYLVLMAKGIKTLEGRLLKSPTSFVAKVRAGDTVQFQSGNDKDGVSEQLHFLVSARPKRFSCASDMINSVDLNSLVPGVPNSHAALLVYWRIATARWLSLDTTRETNQSDRRTASSLVARHLKAKEDSADLLVRSANEMEAGLRLMGVRPPTYKAASMLATLKKVVTTGSKVGMLRDTAATKALSESDAIKWDRWVRNQPDLEYVVWQGKATWFHIAGLQFTTATTSPQMSESAGKSVLKDVPDDLDTQLRVLTKVPRLSITVPFM
tara:strand:- start:101 stop:922 length:822 start_codon:yes stop_codon:yes gene_type:complete